MSETSNWVTNGDYSIHPIMRCNNCDSIFQGPHRCKYDDLASKNEKLRMELYEMKTKELVADLFKDVIVDADVGELNIKLLRANVENMRLRKAIESALTSFDSNDRVDGIVALEEAIRND